MSLLGSNLLCVTGVQERPKMQLIVLLNYGAQNESSTDVFAVLSKVVPKRQRIAFVSGPCDAQRRDICTMSSGGNRATDNARTT